MSDWSAVYLDNTLGDGPGLRRRRLRGVLAGHGPRPPLRRPPDGEDRTDHPRPLCGAIAAVGLGVALAVGNPIFALVGFACAGAGFSIVFPLALSAAGGTEDVATGPALAAVSTAGYTGFLVGPPTIGFVAELAGLGTALYLVVGLSTAVFLLGGTVKTAERQGKVVRRMPA